jgi:hypothetical protein
MKILEIASGISSIVALIVALWVEWHGPVVLRNYIAIATFTSIAIFVYLRLKRKSKSADSSQANISRRNTGISNQIVGDGNQVFVGTPSPAAPQAPRNLVYGFGVMWEGAVPYCPACQEVPMHTIVSGGVPLSFSCARCDFATRPVDEDGNEISPPEAIRRMKTGATADPDLVAYQAKLSELRNSGGAGNAWTIPPNDPDRLLFERLAERGMVENLFGDHFVPKNSLNPRVFHR